MSEFIIEILDPSTNIIEVETSYLDIVNNIEIERSDSFNIEIINTERILATDLPDNIPLTKFKITGPFDDIGRNNKRPPIRYYDEWGNLIIKDSLNYYLDHYPFDGGTP